MDIPTQTIHLTGDIQHITYPTTSYYLAPSHWCRDVRPCSGTVLYMEGPVLNCLY